MGCDSQFDGLYTRRGYGMAVIPVDRSLLKTLFPEGTEIVSIAPSRFHGAWDFVVRHADLPEVPQGAEYPQAQILAEKVYAHFKVLD